MFTGLSVRIIIIIIIVGLLFLQAALYAGGKKEVMISKQEVDDLMEDSLFSECRVCALCQPYLSAKIDVVQGKISRKALKNLIKQVNTWHKKGHRSVDPVTCSPQRSEDELIKFEKRALRRSGQ